MLMNMVLKSESITGISQAIKLLYSVKVWQSFTINSEHAVSHLSLVYSYMLREVVDINNQCQTNITLKFGYNFVKTIFQRIVNGW